MVRERADRNGGSAPIPASTGLNVAELRQLIMMMEQSDIEEITIENEADGLHLALRKPAPLTLDAAALMMAEESHESVMLAEPEPAAEPDVPTFDVRSTLVGLYRAVGRRGAKPLAAGDKVKEGQIVGAVEALRVLNEIETPAAGRVRKVLVNDGQPVEFGQVLMTVESDA